MNKILLTILIFFTFIKIQPAQSLSQQVPEFQSTDIKCAICIEDMLPVNAITSLQCNHTFHTECIDRCLENNTICPICRRSTIHNDNLRIEEIYSNIVILDQTITIWTEIFYTINGQRHYFYVDIKEKITKDATNSLLHKLESLFTTLLNPNTFNLNEENNARLATVIINSMRQYINQFNDAIESKAPYLDSIRSVKKITSISLGILTAAISLVLLNKYPSENYYNFLSNYTMY